MIAIILAAGMGTRMYPLTKNRPKALLPLLDGSTFLDHLLSNIQTIAQIQDVVVTINPKHHKCFTDWRSNHDVTLYVAQEDNNVIESLQTIQSSLNNAQDLLVAAVDNLLFFELRYFADFFFEKRNYITAMYYDEPNISELQKTGVAFIQDEYIIEMEEKPIHPKYNYAIPPFYIIPAKKREQIAKYLHTERQADSIGSFIRWCVKNDSVRAFPMPGKRLNLGNKEAYLKYITNVINHYHFNASEGL